MGLHLQQVHRLQPKSPAVYLRHRPEATLLYQIVREYWPEFQAALAEICSECGGDVRIIAGIEDPVVIQKVLAHLDNTTSSAATALLPDCRTSPSLPLDLFD